MGRHNEELHPLFRVIAPQTAAHPRRKIPRGKRSKRMETRQNSEGFSRNCKYHKPATAPNLWQSGNWLENGGGGS